MGFVLKRTIILLLSIISVCYGCQKGRLIMNKNEKQESLFDLKLNQENLTLKDVKFGFELSDGTSVLSNDKRFSMKTETFQPEDIFGVDTAQKISCTDSQQEFVIFTEIIFIDENNLAMRTGLINRKKYPVNLHRICVCYGNVDYSGKTNILTNVSGVFPLIDDVPIYSEMFIALKKPSITVGFLTGQHTAGNFTITKNNKNIKLKINGNCDGCRFPPGQERYSDWILITAQNNSIKGLETYGTWAGKINNCSIWPHNFACLCTWYSDICFTNCNNGKLEKFARPDTSV